MQPEDDLLKNWIQFWNSGPGSPEALTRLFLLGMDVESLRFALHDFTEAQKAYKEEK
jgi:hypothetical protein